MSQSSRLPDINLDRTSRLIQIEAMVEMRRQVDREELIVLLRFIKETIDGGEKLTPQKVVDDWLVGFPVSSGKRLLRLLEDLGLIERNSRGRKKAEILPSPTTTYVLTEAGAEVEATDTLFMPERLAAVIQYVTDPLIPSRIISVEISREKLKSFISKNDRGWNELDEYDSISLPEELKEIEGKQITVYEGDRTGQVIIDSFGPRVISSQHKSKIQLNLTLSPQHPPLLSIETDSQTHEIVMDKNLISQLEYKRVLANLIRQAGKRWSEKKEAISVRFGETEYHERKSFVTDLRITNPEIENLGSFKSCTLKRVPIAPRTLADAQKWYEFRIADEIDSYLTEIGYERFAEAKKGDFTRFGFEPETPLLQEIIARYSSIQDNNAYHPIYWFLNAPRDLTLARDV